MYFRDLTALARAAVSGDESALDMFNWKKPIPGKPGGSTFGAPAEALGFYVGTEGGKLPACTVIFNVVVATVAVGDIV